ncbi:MAG: Ig-like domain-containing protein [Oscillospiraceae bacterium]
MKKAIAMVVACLCLAGWATGLGAPAARAAEAGATTEIWDRAGLEAMAEDPGASYRLMAHIDMGDAPWAPIPFDGTFDGGGFALYNLSIQEADAQTAVSVDGNRKPYDTVFAALFSRCVGASIQNLELLGVQLALDTTENAYVAGLVGYGEGVTITDCRVEGRLALRMPNKMCGIAGIMGFGYGTIARCSADVELVLVDTNDAMNCEEFMGGILASGYADIEGCTVKLAAYTSVHGYVHNGGVVGMYYVHTDDTGHAGAVRGNTVDATIRFFEHVASRRAYSAAVIGEQMHWILEIADNTVAQFTSDETQDYSAPLLPERCAQPQYTQALTAPGCEHFGHTTHSCAGCGYSYVANYTAPAHTPGQWQLAAGQPGVMEQHCTVCGALCASKETIPAAECTLSHAQLALAPGETAQLAAGVQPEDVTEPGVWFTSSDEAVATVDETGFVAAHKAGEATITATSADGFATAACAVTVRAPLPVGWVVLGAAGLVALVVGAVLLLAARRKKRRVQRRAQRAVYRRR